jgi:predicted RNA-binding protein associated with RNAse of E/G family
VFKKYKEKGVFSEFLVDVLRNRLDSAMTIEDLLARLDLLYFDETEKAKMFIDIWFQTLNGLEPM